MLVDTHCHLADSAFAADLGEVAARWRMGGVKHVIIIGENLESAVEALRLAQELPDASATAGIHPHHADSWNRDTAGRLRSALAASRVLAVGETGLDYHYQFAPRAKQIEALESQLSLAGELGLPAIIHAREADDDMAGILRNHPRTRAVLHSFSSGEKLLTTALGLGHYISFSGMITFKNWRHDALIKMVPLDRLLVETDSPYLAPMPYRGKRNEPANVKMVAQRLAVVTGVDEGEITTITGRNAATVFGHGITSYEEQA